MKNRTKILLSVGLLNFLHGLFHIIQSIQSIMLVTYSTQHSHIHSHDNKETLLDQVLHSPIMAIIWSIVGIVTLVIGIKDYRHHKKRCTHE